MMATSRTPNPKVAAVVCTILGHRGASARTTSAHEVARCVEALLANSYTPLEVIVVDQSPHDAVATALRPLCEADVRLRYIHTHIRGLTRSQNRAVKSSDAEIFAFTDDDCIVPTDWVERIVETFRRRPDAGLLFGDVRPPAGHDWATSFVPQLHFAQEERLRPSFLPRVHSLMGANMAVRRETFTRIGLLEEAFGARPYNGEVELALRALRTRPPIGVYLTPAFHVVHEYGSRPQGKPAQRLLRTYHMGKSAMLTTHALHGDLGAACKLGLLAFEPFVEGAINLLRTGKPRGAGMIVPYVEGIICGLPAAPRSGGRPLSAQDQEP